MNRLAIFLMVGGSLVAGCKKTVKTAEVEGWMKSRTAELGINATKVTCPKSIEPKEGKSFDCDIEVEGKTYTITGTVTKVEEKKVNFDTAWKNGANGVIIRAKLQPALTEELSKQFAAKVEVTCPEPLLYLDDKRATTCDLVAGATKAKLTTTFDDKLAATGWKLDPPLLAKKKVEELVTASVKEKVGPSATVDCGTEPLIARPADGKLMCVGRATEKGKAAETKLAIEIAPDLSVTRWDAVP